MYNHRKKSKIKEGLLSLNEFVGGDDDMGCVVMVRYHDNLCTVNNLLPECQCNRSGGVCLTYEAVIVALAVT